mgnify:CR=1 FL=1
MSNQFDDPWATTNENTPKKENVVSVSSDVKHPFSVKLTLKADAGHGAEWLNPWVSAETADELATNVLALLDAFKRHGVIEVVSSAAHFTRSQYKGGAPAPARQSAPRQSAPPVQQSAPQGGNDTCGHTENGQFVSHGARVYKSGTKANGEAWSARFCPLQKGDPNRCRPIWGKA